VKAVFGEWLEREFPERAKHVESAVRSMHGGKLYDARWNIRGRGQDERAGQISRTFRVFAKRFGLGAPGAGLSGAAFRRPTVMEEGQMGLFG
jgi:DNA repair photolyase